MTISEPYPLFERISSMFGEPIFVFTSDLDWAPEWAIRELVGLFDDSHIPLTPFVTHQSRVIDEKYGKEGMKSRVGVHPNFLEGSTHGSRLSAVVDCVCRLWPEARGFRSHSFYDHTHVTDEFRRRGFQYDSNLCLFLQPRCVPLHHNSGMMRFPIFWEDDYHFTKFKQIPFDIDAVQKYLDSPGLKVFNTHPFHFALNMNSGEAYAKRRHLYNTPEGEAWRSFIIDGKGVRTFITDVIDRVRRKRVRAVYLDDLCQEITKGLSYPVSQVDEERAEDSKDFYQSASSEQKAAFVRNIYDSRDGKMIYATSRDTNLRELEISFISKHVKTGRILDIGCGNGYTLISLAKHMKADYLGLDFSPKMIESANKLTKMFEAELLSTPAFRLCDVRNLPFGDSTFDFIISERCLLNLPSKDAQYKTIREVHRVLKEGGVYVMVEGTDDGLSRLNLVRQKLGLGEIPSVSPDNPTALKFKEAELDSFLRPLFKVEVTQFFGTYYLISRVVHPLLVYPESPRFDAKINTVARLVAEVVPDVGRIGHVVGYKLVAKK